MLLEGKKIFITGGSRGIGKTCAERCIEEGAEITVMGRSADTLNETKTQLGDKCHIFQGDVTNYEDVVKGLNYAVEQMGGITGAVNNAGANKAHPLLEMSNEDFDWTVKLNLYGVFYCVKAEAEIMKKTGGSIVNISSLTSTLPSTGNCAYSASKAGVDMFTKAAAFELGQYGIRVNAVRPGFTRTTGPAADILWNMPEVQAEVFGATPIRDFVYPVDIANDVLVLLSDLTVRTTGTVHLVDGGLELAGFPDISESVAKLYSQMK